MILNVFINKLSSELAGHMARVSAYSALLGKHYGLSEEEIELLRNSSLLYDLGMTTLPDHIVMKPGKFTDEEREIMQTHTKSGYDIFSTSQESIYKTAAILADSHHEKYDGAGYPKGLKGDDIHLYARIVALADVFDALSTAKVYKEAWSTEQILQYIKEQSGVHFDPQLVDIFFENIDQFLEVKLQLQDLSPHETIEQSSQQSKSETSIKTDDNDENTVSNIHNTDKTEDTIEMYRRFMG